MQPLPRDFLTKVAQDYNLTEEQQGAFVALLISDEEFWKIAETLGITSGALRSRMTGVYLKFSMGGRSPNKREDLRKFLMKEYQKSQGSTIAEPSNPAIDIEFLVKQAREMVRADIQDRCDTMRVLDMSRPIRLDDIYTHVNILETVTGRRRKPIAELLEDCRAYDWERFGLGKRTEERVPGLQAVAKYSKLIILGKPGAGKTTFLKYLAIQCIDEGKFLGDRLPIFITLKDFAEAPNQPSLLEYIAQFNRDLSLPEILQQGKGLVLLDGLDEVREEDSKRILKEIRNCSHQFRENYFIMTCRIAAREYTFEKFTEVEIADFDKTQLTNFANKWFKNKAIKPETFLNQIENNQRIQELATSPLLLTLLCLTFEETGDFPANRSELYKEGLDVLLKKWDATRGIYRDQVYKKLSPQRKEDLLSKIALTTFEAGYYFFKQKEAERYITDYIRNLPGANTDEEALQLDSEAVLSSIEEQHGLLIERAKGIFSFSHLTFHEYFTARELIINQQSSEEALQKLVSHLTDRQWREVFLLATGMSSCAKRLLLLMKHKVEHLIDGFENLEKILNRVNNHNFLGYEWNIVDKLHLISGVDSWLQLSEFALFESESGLFESESGLFESNKICIIWGHNKFLVITLPFTMVVLGFSQILAEDIVLEFADDSFHGFVKIPDLLKDSLIAEVGTGDILGLWQSWLKELKINNILETVEVIINVNNYIHCPEEAKSVEQYHYANQLLLDCLNSDCYVSREVREEIEETLLLPIAEIEKRKAEKRQSP